MGCASSQQDRAAMAAVDTMNRLELKLETFEEIDPCLGQDVRHGRVDARIGTSHLMAQFFKKDGSVPHRRPAHPNKEYPHQVGVCRKSWLSKTKIHEIS